MNADAINSLVVYLRQAATPETYEVLEKAAQFVESHLFDARQNEAKKYDSLDLSRERRAGFEHGVREAIRAIEDKYEVFSDE